ncbi:xyloglucan galactosyltransferase XLT2-like [Olea europaea var. sylvestris]|uniref:xyloglucan galactosyltransferase XLT2-like n=1 Tax=Olea europaea var. sylvestris TaxID=158386 RepID=UPI000C1D0D5C|nr:xyloglucan galactosyltransferase XLT2-like [Olea europaea var. sylvestris]
MVEHSLFESQPPKKSRTFLPKNTLNSVKVSLYRCLSLSVILLFQILVLNFFLGATSNSVSIHTRIVQEKPKILPLPSLQNEECQSGKVYVYDLPVMFNKELIDNCQDLDPWHSRCNAVSNYGFGPITAGLSAGMPENLAPAWYWTDMFAGEIIYHSRMMKHKCRTTEPELATAFYIPFYAGLAVAKYLFTNYTVKERDWHSVMLLKWLQDQPYWQISNGSDHFIMLGRMTWDFRRSKNQDWGSSFIYMPLMKQILRLCVERNPWDHLEISVPYPTGFHPKSKSDLDQWLNFVQTRNRTNLFTFVGGKRKVKSDFRSLLSSHCYNESDSCHIVDCSGTRCYDGTWEILEAFLDSDFCLQPRGDSHTRKSTFDCMLAGSIPVFFWKRSIYNQYQWFLTDEPENFSVFIDRKDVRSGVSIKKVLKGYDRERIRRMRQKVVEFIPRFVYNYIGSDEMGNTEDAFDLAIDGVLKRFKEEKRYKNAEFQEE